MICLRCGDPGAKRNGMGRAWCIKGQHSFTIPPELTPEEISEAALTKQGWAPEHGIEALQPLGLKLKGTTTLTDLRSGERVLQWVKADEDRAAQQRAMEAAIAAMSETLPREAPRPMPESVLVDLANCYVLTDYHLGMLSWGEETGDDWDLKIAEEMLVDWFAAAIAQAPAAQVGIFAQLGDFLHWDGMDAVTPASKHLLDADTRFQKLVRVAIRAIRRVIGMLLEKHAVVHVIAAEGNHDPASSIWLREWLHALYEDEPRVVVDVNPDPYYCFEWGATALFFHHGHKRRPANIDHVFAAKFREVFGRTKYAYAHMGHLHHIDMKETTLMVVEQHRTLAGSDAYASRGGWLSGRDAQVITYHREFGEVGRVRVSSKMLDRHAPPKRRRRSAA